MEKRYKTDYFEKINLLASICNDNIFYVQKIISSEQFLFEKNVVTGKNIIPEIKSSLEKDYFAPFEREDIYIICEKLNELSENTYFLYNYVSDNNIFGFPGNIIALVENLKKTAESILVIFTILSRNQKKSDLKDHIDKAEDVQKELKKQFYDCLKRSQGDIYNLIIHIIEKCAENCKEIIQLIHYTLFKNS